MKYIQQLAIKYFGPKSEDPDIYRKELVLNSMLAFCFFLLIVFEALTISHEIRNESHIGALVFLITLLPISVSYYFSRAGRINIASAIFISLFAVGSFYAMIMWGIFLPAGLLSIILIIQLTSILISGQIGFLYAIGSGCILVGLAGLFSSGEFAYDSSWQDSKPSLADGIELAIFITFISVVSWLSNNQTYNSLKRARQSEKELRAERDNLDRKVIERTRQLEDAQIEKISSLYKFIEFGKLSSGLIHDLINPLNALCIEIETKPAYLNINQNSEQNSADRAVKNSIKSLMDTSVKIKNIIKSTRKHIQVSFKEEEFLIKDIIDQTLLIHAYRINKNHITVTTKIQSGPTLLGSPSLFTHIITNLISNAIDAIEETKIKDANKHYRPIIHIEAEVVNQHIHIIIKDNGIGIPADIVNNVFNPFFSTKDGRGCGYGLSASRYMTEKYFGGSLNLVLRNPKADSSKANKIKTIFNLILPLRRNINS